MGAAATAVRLMRLALADPLCPSLVRLPELALRTMLTALMWEGTACTVALAAASGASSSAGAAKTRAGVVGGLSAALPHADCRLLPIARTSGAAPANDLQARTCQGLGALQPLQKADDCARAPRQPRQPAECLCGIVVVAELAAGRAGAHAGHGRCARQRENGHDGAGDHLDQAHCRQRRGDHTVRKLSQQPAAFWCSLAVGSRDRHSCPRPLHHHGIRPAPCQEAVDGCTAACQPMSCGSTS